MVSKYFTNKYVQGKRDCVKTGEAMPNCVDGVGRM